MRNLKRALSLALASVMLLGMMVVGTSAASTSNFTDADKIVNAEAVDLTTGLDIFKGYTDGSFGPDKAVSRAEAAVVIAKILHGSDVNPANFAGAGKFNDVAPWAEGYVNLVASLGIIVGVGENQFAPDRTVSTVEFSTMLLKALGYYVEADALGADWMLEVTSKANALGLYGDLELSMTAPLTRENVAVMTMNALFAQRVAYDDVRGLYVKNSDRNVVVTNGTIDEYNTLAQNTYGLYAVEGLVVENGYTNKDLTDKTLVVFEDDKDVTGDKKVESEYKFEVATGLDMIGHAATVYYTIEKKAPVVYAIVDDATQVVETFVTNNLTNLAKAEGFDRDTSDTVIVENYNLVDASAVVAGTGYKAYENDPMILISNNSSKTVDYAIILDQDLDYVTDITVDDSDEEEPVTTYDLEVNTNLTDDTNCVVIGEVEEKDYVILTKVNANMTVIEAADVENVMLTEVDRKAGETKKLYAEEQTYTKATTDVNVALIDTDVTTADGFTVTGTCDEKYAVTKYIDVLVAGEYALIYDNYERLIAVSPVVEDETVNVAYVAQFGYKINTLPSLNDDYLVTAHVYFADGTDGVYYVDNTDGIFEKVVVDKDGNLSEKRTAGATIVDVATTDTIAHLNTSNTANGAGDFIKLYDVDVNSDNTVTIDELKGQGIRGANVINDYTSYGAVAGVIDHIEKGVTFLGESAAPINFYGNSKTIFWFVDGSYTADTLTVGTAIGMSNVPTIDVDKLGGNDEGVVSQAAASQKTGASYAVVDTVLVSDYEYVTTQSGVYYYNGSYNVKRVAANEYTLTYKLYDVATGEAYSMSYADIYTDDDEARDVAKAKAVGYYVDGGDDIEAAVIVTEDPTNYKGTNIEYVVNGVFKDYIDLGDDLTLYTVKSTTGTVNEYRDGITINEDTIFVNLTSTKFSTLEEMAEIIEANHASYTNAGVAIPEYTGGSVDKTAQLSYVYENDDNIVDIIFVTSIVGNYDKDYTGTGSNTTTNINDVTLAKTANSGMFKVTVDPDGTMAKDTVVEIAVYYASDAGSDAKVDSMTYTVAADTAADIVINTGIAVEESGNYYAVVTVDGATVTTETVRIVYSAS